MTLISWIFAVVSGATYIFVFACESLLFQRPGVHQRMFLTPTSQVPAVRLWAFGVGFYNLFFGCGAITGVILWSSGQVEVGRTLVIFTCLSMFLGGIVLVIADRMAMSRPRGTGLGGALAAGGAPLVALIAALL